MAQVFSLILPILKLVISAARDLNLIAGIEKIHKHFSKCGFSVPVMNMLSSIKLKKSDVKTQEKVSLILKRCFAEFTEVAAANKMDIDTMLMKVETSKLCKSTFYKFISKDTIALYSTY